MATPLVGSAICRIHWLLALVAGCGLSGAANASPMTVTVSGTISSGFDAYRNTVYFGPNVGQNLAGMAASISITYETALMTNQAGGAYYTHWHQPAYPYFLGSVGQNPVRSASFTVNGVTLALDVSGPGETGRLSVENFNPANDSYNLSAGDTRSTWCPNDSQCAESAGIQAYSYVNLFDADGFGPDDAYAWTATGLTALTGNVRLFDSALCQPAGQGGQGGAAGLCPTGRFTDYAQFPNTVHWVDFQLNATQLTIAPAVVPVPAAAWLLGSGLVALTGLRRVRSGHGPGAAPTSP